MIPGFFINFQFIRTAQKVREGLGRARRGGTATDGRARKGLRRASGGRRSQVDLLAAIRGRPGIVPFPIEKA